MIASFPERNFKLWEYSVSHGRLLVRSPIDTGFDTNVDILFIGVHYVAAPWIMRGLQLLQGSVADVERATAEYPGMSPPRTVYALESEGRRHLVVALTYRVSEHDRDIFWSPINHGRTSPGLE